MKTLKSELQALIDEVDDEQVLEAVFTILTKHKTAGFDPDGAPISQEQLKKRAKAASERVKAGDYIAHDHLKQATKENQGE